MVLLIVLAALAVLALTTQAGVLLLQRAHPRQGRMVEVAGAKLHVVELGPQGGAPVVMLHGASSNLEVMRPLAERLSQTHRVILLDRPGHGWSTRENFSDSTPQPQARMISEALEKLGIGKAIVVAHSWSGARALRIARDHPDRVARTVLRARLCY